MQQYDDRAPGPEVVANRIARIVESQSPALRYRVTQEALVLPLLRRFLPASLYEVFMRRGFNVDAKT